jgi:diguanylate cyclase (GGDEF)-like protein
MRPGIARWLAPLGVAAIAALDYAAGPWLRLDPLYYAPVAYGAWRVGKRTGMALSAFSALARVSTSVAAGLLPGHVIAVNAGLQLVGCLGIAVLTARVRSLLTEEHQAARRDPLTGLHNARALRERFVLELARASREPRPLAVASVDLDRFKDVNDRWGHSTGDRVLRRVAEVMVRNLRASDTVARVGGDEFVAVLWGADPAEAEHVLSRLSAEVGASMRESGWPVTTSVGVAVFPACEGTIDEMLARADRALYRAKHRGRDALEIEAPPAAPVGPP